MSQLEDGSAGGRAGIRGGAIEIARLVEDQPDVGKASVVGALKAVEIVFRPARLTLCQLVDRALLVLTADERSAIKIAAVVPHEAVERLNAPESLAQAPNHCLRPGVAVARQGIRR